MFGPHLNTCPGLAAAGPGDGRELFKPHLGLVLPGVVVDHLADNPEQRSRTRRQRAGAIQRGEAGPIGHTPIVRDLTEPIGSAS